MVCPCIPDMYTRLQLQKDLAKAAPTEHGYAEVDWGAFSAESLAQRCSFIPAAATAAAERARAAAEREARPPARRGKKRARG